LNSLQQTPGAPFLLQPFDWNSRLAICSVSAAAALTHTDLPEHQSLRRERKLIHVFAVGDEAQA
jgi:hypothetical protein